MSSTMLLHLHPSSPGRRSLLLLAAATVSVAAFWAGRAEAQETIYLPPVYGGTPYSYQIEADAQRIIAQGYYLKSAAQARKIHAEAYAVELKNWVDEVDDFFKRRELNREWRLKERGGTYLDQEAHRQEVIRKRIQTQFQDVSEGDVTLHLNWLLTELSGPTIAVQYMIGSETLRPLDVKLSDAEKKQIYLNDGGRGGKKLVFSLAEPEMLKTPWPPALLDPQCDAARKEFEAARDAAVQQIRENGRADPQSAEQLVRAVNQLLVTLETLYPHEKRKDPQVFFRYNSARQYLQSLCGQVNRALATNDRSIFDGSLRFQGESVFDLLQYMYQKGLVFERPQEGGERVYSVLFRTMCSLYSSLKAKPEDALPAPPKN